MTVLLRAEGIGKSFGRSTVLKSAAVWAEAGQVSVLLGRNGSGKTTLMRIACGCLRADFGTVRFGEYARERPVLSDLARLGLMYLPQEGLLSNRYSVEQHLDVIAFRYGSYRVVEAVERLRLGECLGLRPWQLSGGERARASLALALIRGPRCLVVDEPLAGLAPLDSDLLAQVLRTMADEGCAVVTSGHDARELLALEDVVLWCVAGTTHHLGPPEQAVGHTQFVREYLGPGFRLPKEA
ncbi:MAG: ABC transporter ATP-binding protein [Gemmatimonadota bacterium]